MEHIFLAIMWLTSLDSIMWKLNYKNILIYILLLDLIKEYLIYLNENCLLFFSKIFINSYFYKIYDGNNYQYLDNKE